MPFGVTLNGFVKYFNHYFGFTSEYQPKGEVNRARNGQISALHSKNALLEGLNHPLFLYFFVIAT
ncbi:MAG: hypothetical protein B0D91_04825 [Oceanospirillales bacterium LUC14_002_19_P2]|nr:MAG: hypothetical protein B0D91_04825 [Oceanospirillales bacterium LUC14_002_19_P2]